MRERGSKSRRRAWPAVEQRLMHGLVWLSAFLALAVLALIVGFVLERGLPSLSARFLFSMPSHMGREGGILPVILGTAYLIALAVLIAAPLGVGTALYLAEYTRGGAGVKLIRFGTEALAGVPSIIFGLFGYALFVLRLGLGWSLLSGALTLSCMVLPTIIRTAEEALRAVPQAYRELSCSLGAGRWQTVTRVVLPSALPGILTGVALAVGRSLGETAAVIFTAGTALRLPLSPLDPARTLSVHFYILAREGISLERAYATAVVLVAAVLVVNLAANWALQRFISRRT